MPAVLRVAVRAAAVATVVGVLAAASPAGAVTAFQPAHRVAGPECFSSRTTMNAAGTTRGFALCGRMSSTGTYALRFMTGSWSATSWRKRTVAQARFLYDAADDGTATYALFATSTAVRMVKVTRGGSVTTWTVHGFTQRVLPPADGALVAVAGRWWADWSVVGDGACACFKVWQAKTMGTRQTAHWTGRFGRQVRLAARSGSEVEMVRVMDSFDYGGRLAVSYSKDTTWGPNHIVVDDPWHATMPDIMRVGSITYLTWLLGADNDHKHYVRFADNRGGTWHKHGFTPIVGYSDLYEFRARPAYLAYSRGHVFVAWSRYTPSGLLSHVAERYDGSWTERSIPDGGTGGDGGQVAGLAAYDGRARLVLEHLVFGATYVAVRHQ